MRFVRGVFYVEVVSNLVSAFLALAAPARFLSMLSPEPVSLFFVEFARWYGVLLLVLTLILFAALRSGSDRFLRPVLAVLLLGDVLQIGLSVRLAMLLGAFTDGVNAAIALSIIYAVARVCYLFAAFART